METTSKAVTELIAALEVAEKYVGCGDNSCVFVKAKGMGTNGGCRCIESARPGVHPALGQLFRVVKCHAPALLDGIGILQRIAGSRSEDELFSLVREARVLVDTALAGGGK